MDSVRITGSDEWGEMINVGTRPLGLIDKYSGDVWSDEGKETRVVVYWIEEEVWAR